MKLRIVLFPFFAFLLGSILTIGVLELFFKLNYHWQFLPTYPISRVSTAKDITISSSDFLKEKGIQVGTLQVALNQPIIMNDFTEPDNYTPNMFNYNFCNSTSSSDPYWIGTCACEISSTLRKKFSGRVVYSVKYGFNKNCLRNVFERSSASYNLLFLGCSYTFGEGVLDNETFAYLLTEYSKNYTGFNLAMMGWGPNHLLKLLQKSDDFRLNSIPKREGVAVYTFIDDHLMRFFNSKNRLKDLGTENDPYYDLIDGEIINQGTFKYNRPITTYILKFLSSSKLLDYFSIDLPIFTTHHLKKFALAIKQLEQELIRKNLASKLIFSFYPGQNLYAKELKTYLDKNGITYLDYSNVFLNQVIGNNEFINGNFHPSPLAHKIYAQLLYADLKEKKLIH